jgi:hypothetical protein
MVRFASRSLLAVSFLAVFTLGVVATTPAFSCGQWPDNCCKPGQQCKGSGSGSDVAALPALPDTPGAWWAAFQFISNLV